MCPSCLFDIYIATCIATYIRILYVRNYIAMYVHTYLHAYVHTYTYVRSYVCTYIILILEYIHSCKFVCNIPEQFDCAAAASELKSQLSTLIHLNYDSMKHSLFAEGVITNKERRIIDARIGQGQMMCLIADIIIPSLNLNVCMKFKGFLKAMEESDDSALKSTAERLGKLMLFRVHYSTV